MDLYTHHVHIIQIVMRVIMDLTVSPVRLARYVHQRHTVRATQQHVPPALINPQILRIPVRLGKLRPAVHGIVIQDIQKTVPALDVTQIHILYPTH